MYIHVHIYIYIVFLLKPWSLASLDFFSCIIHCINMFIGLMRVCVYIYIYICIERERDMRMYIYIYIMWFNTPKWS